MNFNEAVAWLKTMLEIPLNDEDSNFTRILPLMFRYADGRIYRELDFLATTATLLGKLTARKRDTLLPDAVLVLRQLNILTPVFTAVSDNTDRHTPDRVTPEALDMFWPTARVTGLPQKYALVGDVPQAVPLPLAAPPPVPVSQRLSIRVRFGPAPDQAYATEFLGVIRPMPLSASNPETYLSVTYPELFLCACMVFGAGYQRDFGAQADDPQKAMSWDAQYNYLRQGVMLEAARQRGEGPGWSAVPPAPAAQPRAP